jgi:uncharacterized membrane protein YbhN (UPF0104 family)
MTTAFAAAGVDRAIRAVALLVALAAAGYLLLTLYVGWSDLFASVAALGTAALLAGTLLASCNYLLRFLRWHDLLHRMGQRVPPADNLRVYLGGLALTATPGKVGETIRSALLWRWRVPVGASLAAFFVDRLTDVIAVLLLAATTGGGAFWWAATGVAAAAGFALRFAFGARWSEALAAWLDKRHRFASLVGLLRTGMAQYAAVWRLPRVLAYVAIGALAYGLQGAVFAYYVQRLWSEANSVDCLRIFATATLAGAASMIPGGLGAMELALIAQLSLAGMPLASATAAALAVRAVTLWFAILLGLSCLLWYRRRAADALP